MHSPINMFRLGLDFLSDSEMCLTTCCGHSGHTARTILSKFPNKYPIEACLIIHHLIFLPPCSSPELSRRQVATLSPAADKAAPCHCQWFKCRPRITQLYKTHDAATRQTFNTSARRGANFIACVRTNVPLTALSRPRIIAVMVLIHLSS